ncbi:hypothetical protein [Streptomyces sp. SYSU K21746]
MKMVSRSEWGARPYRRPNGATRYAGPRRGVKVHYLGTFYADRPHEQCAAYVRRLQDAHMDGKGWSDIGYSFVVCTHGYVHEGRGLERRNSANGNTALNEQDYAIAALVGSKGLTEPTDDQLHGLRDAVDYCRTEGPAGTWLGGHKDGYSTDCPGGPLYAWAHAGAPRPAPTVEEPTPPPPVEETALMPPVLSESKAGGPLLTPGEWTLLHMANDSAILQGSETGETAYNVHVQVHLTGTTPGMRVQGRFFHHRISDNYKSDGLAIDAVTRDGESFPQFSKAGSLKPGWQLKFEIVADAPGVEVEHRLVQGPYWPTA